MIRIEVDKAQISKIEKALGDLKSKSPSVLKKAINDTAKQARKDLADKAKKEYAVKIGGFNKSMTIKNATVGKMEATIKTKGEALELGQFKASPYKYATGNDRPSQMRAKVLKESSMKALVTSDTKAFVAKFKSGHVAIVQRVPGKTMKSNPQKQFLRKLLSPSIPQMIGNQEKVYGEVEPKIQSLLLENIQKQIDRTLGG